MPRRNNNNIVVRTIDEFLRPKDFVPYRNAWYSTLPETILVVALDKSNWGLCYYLYFGVLVRQLSPLQTPKVNECHIYQRLESILNERQPGEGHVQTLPEPEPTSDSFVDQIRRNPLSPIAVDANNPEFFSTKGFVTPNIARALDLDDHSFTDEQRVAQIKENLCKYGLPFLAELDSLEKMRNTLLNRSLATIFVRRNLRDLLGIATPR